HRRVSTSPLFSYTTLFRSSIANLLMGDNLSTIATDVEVSNYKYPIGVIGGIAPFNFPMMVPFWMFPMAIACGNTVVMKPSEKTRSEEHTSELQSRFELVCR